MNMVEIVCVECGRLKNAGLDSGDRLVTSWTRREKPVTSDFPLEMEVIGWPKD